MFISKTRFRGLYGGKIVTLPGRSGRVHGRGEHYVRFDSLTLPIGVTRDIRAGIGGLDGRANEELDRSEGKIKVRATSPAT